MSKKTTSPMLSYPIESALLADFENLCEVQNFKPESVLDSALREYLNIEGMGMMQNMVAALDAEKPTAKQRRLLKRMPKNKELFDTNARLAREYVAGYMED